MSNTNYPALNENNPPPAGAQLPGWLNSPCRILVVDQNSDLRLLYTDALARSGCRVDVAQDGTTAWAALQTHKYNLLITENERPNLAGDELMMKLRAARVDLPIITVAGSLTALEPARNLPCPIAATLLKPFMLDALLDTVKNVLGRTLPRVRLHPTRAATINGHELERAGEPPGPSQDEAVRPIVVTRSVHGKCYCCEDGVSYTKLERGRILKQGAIIRTGEAARANLMVGPSGTSVRLHAHTKIKLEKMELAITDGLPVVHTLLHLRAGKILTVVHSTEAGHTLEIRNTAARSVAKVSRCVITADGAHVWAQGSAMPIQVRGENGKTIIAAGPHLARRVGKMLPAFRNL
jgi:CheY-like chemotaxis protein